ncbi:LysR family transcriptional regulator [Actinopolymorpha pittospori]|uniref:DNA-binding transcriptional LysR family regulator n=1 Tax=Actinopolymorpha pittospori TaxID=648752 RepID=A0A927MWN0_9ACTN|nr:LysR family transcriptional regulator [Actinopolymorpha pittospori]MBE1604615.1 DNA-binding transcriptional LysR family regulator [Actinopolymorpha pittospori]
MDLDLRKLRYFVEVAEQLHFGRAAENLHITQPVLSRQINRLERELGVSLFHRSSRQVSLTEAGEQLLEEARSLLAGADAAQRRVLAAGNGPRTLTVGFMAGLSVNRAINAFSDRYPDINVDIRRIEWYDQAEVIRDGVVDVAFVRPPIEDQGLWIRTLYAEPRLAVLPASHRFAGRRSLSIMELADDPVVMHLNASPAWDAFCNTDPRPDGRHPVPGPAIRTMDEKLEHVAAGRAITFLPESAAHYYLRRDVVCVPVTDIPPHPVCLAGPADRDTDLIEAFAETAVAIRPAA